MYGLAGIRTQGLRLAKAALYQLSYKPLVVWPSYDYKLSLAGRYSLALTTFQLPIGMISVPVWHAKL
jgi:hypothetical protein